MADTKNVETIAKGAGSADLSAIQSTLDNMSAKLSAIRDLSASQLSELSTLIEVSKTSDQPSLRDKATAFMDSGPAKPVAAPAPATPAAAPAAKGGGDKEEGGMGPMAMMAVAGVAAAAAALAGILSVDADAIKKKVETLLSIVELPNMNAKAVAGVSATLLALGTGLAVFGVGSAVAGVGEAVANFMGVGEGDADWAETIKGNVATLLTIGELPGMDGKNVATVALTLGGLGAGLAAFAVGKTAAGVAEGASSAIEKFGGGGFNAEQIVQEVSTLLSIMEDPNVGVKNALGFIGIMGALGAGLAAYAVGKAAEGGGEGVQGAAEHIQKFGNNAGFGERVKQEVTALLSIMSDPNVSVTGALGFIGIMGALGAGLAAYAVGKAAEGGASGIQGAADHIAKFGETPFAERVKGEVATLLTIPSLPGADIETAKTFGAVMGLLGAGLAAFALGKGAEGAAEGAQAAIKSFSEGEGFATRIKNEVTGLLSILGNENVSIEKSETFSTVLGNIADGLTKFAASKFVDTFASIGSAIAGFFTGEESTIGQVLKLAASTDDLVKVAGSLDKVQASLDKFAAIKVNTDNLNIDDLVKQLGNSLPNLEVLAYGGELQGSGTFKDTVIKKGLLDPDLKLDEMVEAINKFNQIIGIGGGSPDSPPSVAPGATQQGAATKSQMVDQVGIQAGAVNLSSPVVNITAPPAQGEGGGGGDAGVRTNNVVAPRSGQLGKDVTKNFAYGA